VLCISEDQHIEITDTKAYWTGHDRAPDAELSGGSARASTRGNPPRMPAAGALGGSGSGAERSLAVGPVLRRSKLGARFHQQLPGVVGSLSVYR
jgi:hypothetical protein